MASESLGLAKGKKTGDSFILRHLSQKMKRSDDSVTRQPQQVIFAVIILPESSLGGFCRLESRQEPED